MGLAFNENRIYIKIAFVDTLLARLICGVKFDYMEIGGLLTL